MPSFSGPASTSWWDAMVVHAAAMSGARVLYSEDFEHGSAIAEFVWSILSFESIGPKPVRSLRRTLLEVVNDFARSREEDQQTETWAYNNRLQATRLLRLQLGPVAV